MINAHNTLYLLKFYLLWLSLSIEVKLVWCVQLIYMYIYLQTLLLKVLDIEYNNLGWEFELSKKLFFNLIFGPLCRYIVNNCKYNGREHDRMISIMIEHDTFILICHFILC